MNGVDWDDDDSFELLSVESNSYVDTATNIAKEALNTTTSEGDKRILKVSQSSMPANPKVPAVALTILKDRGIEPEIVAQICKRSGLNPSGLLILLEKIDKYEKTATVSKEQTLRVYKDPFLNSSAQETLGDKKLAETFTDRLTNSLIRVNNEWLILLKGKGPAEIATI